jgi:two-component system, OmpR family, sensor kinase
MVGERASRAVGKTISWPRRWPVTWRLAAVSAALTFAILIVFALIVGRSFQNRLTADFHAELQAAATELAFEIQLSGRGITATPDLEEVAMADRAEVRVVSDSGEAFAQTPGSGDLGPPQPGIDKVGPLQVATAPVSTSQLGAPAIYVQYARSHDDLQATIDRLWLFLGAGVLAGTLLALFAGMVVARGAMRPIVGLTASAREIASTRDPSRHMPRPEADDEVGELAATLEEMLRSLDAARGEREQMMQAQRDFVADASHELRTPLTSTLANLELLAASLERSGSEEDREATASALRSSRRMSRLVSDLLLLARADAGRAGARRDCDLAEVVRAATAEAEPVADGHVLAVEADGPVSVVGNPDELHRMALNLIDNAIIHTPPGTEVRVRVGANGDDALLEVSDNGPGIPEELREQVFGRFVRGSGPADQAVGGGTGLGLAIVRSVADAHGGSVAADRSPAGGARITVRLPLGEPARTPATARV